MPNKTKEQEKIEELEEKVQRLEYMMLQHGLRLGSDVNIGSTNWVINNYHIAQWVAGTPLPLDDDSSYVRLINGKLEIRGGSLDITTASSGARMEMTSAGMETFNAGGDKTFDLDFTTGDLVMIGTITATAGAIGGYEIGADYIRDVADSMGMASTVTGGDDVRFWAGEAFANRATAPFHVHESGIVTCLNGNFGGTIIDNIVMGAGGAITIDTDAVILNSDGVTLRVNPGASYDLSSSLKFDFGGVDAYIIGAYNNGVNSYTFVETQALAGTPSYGMFKVKAPTTYDADAYFGSQSGSNLMNLIITMDDDDLTNSRLYLYNTNNSTIFTIKYTGDITTTGNLTMAAGKKLSIDHIAELTGAHGVVVDNNLVGTLNITANKSYHAVIGNPAQITANQNNYNPGEYSIINLNSDAARDITGIVAPATTGQIMILYNWGGFAITLKQDSASSTAANRFTNKGAVDMILAAANGTATYFYDSSGARWRQIA